MATALSDLGTAIAVVPPSGTELELNRTSRTEMAGVSTRIIAIRLASGWVFKNVFIYLTPNNLAVVIQRRFYFRPFPASAGEA